MGENTEVLYSKSSAETPQNRSSLNRQRPQQPPSGGRHLNDVARREFYFKTRVRRHVSNPHEFVVEAQSATTTGANQHEHEKSVLTVVPNGLMTGVANEALVGSPFRVALKLNSTDNPRRHPLLFLVPEEPYLRKPDTTPKAPASEKHLDVGDSPDEESLSPINLSDSKSIEVSRIVRQSEVRRNSDVKRPDANKLNNDVRKNILIGRTGRNNSRTLKGFRTHGVELTNLGKNTLNGRNETSPRNEDQSRNQGEEYVEENKTKTYYPFRGSALPKTNVEEERWPNGLRPYATPNHTESATSAGYLSNTLRTSFTTFDPQRTPTATPGMMTTSATTRIGYFVGGQCECSCPCLDAGWVDDSSYSTTQQYQTLQALSELTTQQTNSTEEVTEEDGSTTSENEPTTDSTVVDTTTAWTSDGSTPSTQAELTSETNLGDETPTSQTTDSTTEVDFSTSSEVATSTSTSDFGCPEVTPQPPMILVLEGETVVF